MQVRKLAHYSIRSFDLEKSSHFYEKVLGFTPGYRPPFDFPGVWLYMGGDEQDFGTVHIIGIENCAKGRGMFSGNVSNTRLTVPIVRTLASASPPPTPRTIPRMTRLRRAMRSIPHAAPKAKNGAHATR